MFSIIAISPLLLSASLWGFTKAQNDITCIDTTQGIPVNLTSCQLALSDFDTDPHFQNYPLPANQVIISEGGGYSACGFGVHNNASTTFILNKQFIANKFQDMYNACATIGKNGRWFFPGGEQYLELWNIQDGIWRKRAVTVPQTEHDSQFSCDGVNGVVALRATDCDEVITTFAGSSSSKGSLYLPARSCKDANHATCAGSVCNLLDASVSISESWLRKTMTDTLINQDVAVNGSGGDWSDGHKQIRFFHNLE